MKQTKIQAASDLRDLMATEIWKIWEHIGISSRENLDSNYYENFVNSRIKEWPYFTHEQIKKRIYKYPHIVETSEIFEEIDEKSTKENPYILKKRY